MFNPNLFWDEVPEDAIAHDMAESVFNSMSFRYGNWMSKQRKRMRNDFTRMVMSSLKANYETNMTQDKIDEQSRILINNIKAYLMGSNDKDLNDFAKGKDWRLAVDQLVKASFVTTGLHDYIVNLKQALNYYRVQRVTVKAGILEYRLLLSGLAILGLAIVIGISGLMIHHILG